MSEQNTNLIEIEETHHLAVEQTVMERILNKALDSDVDMDRLERLLDLREQEIKRQERQNFVRDLSAVQMAYKNIEQNAINKHTNSKYATLDQYIDAVKDGLATYKFALFYRIKNQTEKNVTIEITLSHPSGNEISTEGTFPIDSTGSKNSIQSLGSTLTYARRYLLGMLLNLASKEDDTDGQMQAKEDDTNNQKVSSKQIKQIEELIEQTESDKNKLLSYAKVEKLTDMSCETADDVLKILESKPRIQRESALQSLPPQEKTYVPIQDAEYIHVQDIEYVSQEQRTAV
ncbi:MULTISPECIES: ERF family protein [unclassified Bartonella]|uniref:ERF family protein n=1 Tax=unclassified Bartonella TaxID=2645622 RepID=UPI00235E54D2|nr:ERF family protein [Bartonella sp. CM31XJBT]